MREAIRIAKATAKDAGYEDAYVTDTQYDEDNGAYDVELQEDEIIINVSIDEESGEVTNFSTD